MVVTTGRNRTFRPIKRPDGPLNPVDKTVWAVAQMWNQQDDELAAALFSLSPHLGDRRQLITDAIYRYHSSDQWRIAEDLRKLADAIYGAVGPWVR